MTVFVGASLTGCDKIVIDFALEIAQRPENMVKVGKHRPSLMLSNSGCYAQDCRKKPF
jgi:hypothetical protein